MIVRRYRKSDLRLIESWHRERGRPSPIPSLIPQVGYIAFNEKQPVAAAFLRKAEGGIAIFDGLITNPAAPSSARDVALDLAVSQLIEYAKQSGLKGIIAWSEDKNTLLRASRHGFVQSPQTVIMLSLV